MTLARTFRAGVLCGLLATLAACGGISSGKGLFGGSKQPEQKSVDFNAATGESSADFRAETLRHRSRIEDLFNYNSNPNTNVAVNRFIWDAALDVLNFLPVKSVDPFTGVIVMGYGTPPGGGRAYRATIYVTDPALDARSLKVALATRSGPVSAATQQAVVDAILTRARQLRIAAGKL